MRGGEGQEVDVSLAESVLALTEGMVTEYGATGHIREREGNTLPGVAPSNIYEASDGSWVVIAANADGPFRRLFELMGRIDLANAPDLRSNEGRFAARDRLDQAIADWARSRSAAEIERSLEEAGVPAARIYTAADVFRDEHFRAREMVIQAPDADLGDLTMTGVTPKLSGTPGRVRWTGRRLGADTDDVMGTILGLAPEEIEKKRRGGAL